MDRETWRFINSFAPWLAAFGTLSAVIVSLYLALRTARVKVRIASGIYNAARMGQRLRDGQELLQIKATNVGFREATVTGIMWRYSPWFGRRRNMVVIPPADPYSTKLPTKLEYGDEAAFLFPLPEFEAGSKDTIFAILRNARFPRHACRRLYCGVYTTTGHEIIARIDSTIRDYLLERIDEKKKRATSQE